MKFDWQRLFNPIYWVQSDSTDWGWDENLNLVLDKNPPIKSRYCKDTVELLGIEVWVSNWPYSYGTNYTNGSGLPSVATRKRLKRYVEDGKNRKVKQKILEASE